MAPQLLRLRGHLAAAVVVATLAALVAPASAQERNEEEARDSIEIRGGPCDGFYPHIEYWKESDGEEGANFIEIRGGASGGGVSDGFSRHLEYWRSSPRGLVGDFFYTGNPQQNLFYAGIGFTFGRSSTFAITPLVYAVGGQDGAERGASLALFAERDKPNPRFEAFIGHFRPIRADSASYTFLDSLDLTWGGRVWSAGPSASFLRSEGDWTWFAGPVIVRQDPWGAWKAYLWGGTHDEFRLARTFSF